ncbi:MAG: superoxide dismutase family protein [Egibacteraceae bacterium]
MISTIRRLLVPAVAVALAAACASPASQSAGEPFASAQLRAADGAEIGDVQFFEEAGATMVRVNVTVPDGVTAADAFHGFHIHANDDPANGEGCVADPNADPMTWFVSADGHWRADPQAHADHLGDMPPLLVTRDGTASMTFRTSRILAPADIVGRAVILHDGPDNLGNIPIGGGPEQYTPNSPDAVDLTGRTGNAGVRIACGLIG